MANKILTVFLLLLIISFIVTACGEIPSKNNASSLNGEDASNGSTPDGESDNDPNGEIQLSIQGDLLQSLFQIMSIYWACLLLWLTSSTLGSILFNIQR